MDSKIIMKNYLVILAMSTLVVAAGCTSKEKKALDNAISSRSLSQLRQFIKECPTEKAQLIDSAKAVIAIWEQDSNYYDQIKQTEDVVLRTEAEVNYINQYSQGLYIDSVIAMYDIDAPQAESVIARRKAVAEHLNTYRKNIKDILFYYKPNKYWTHIIVMSPPDEEGKGEGIYAYFPDNDDLTFMGDRSDFTYAINLEDLEDNDINCRWKKSGSLFTIEIYDDKSLYVTNQGKLFSFMGQRDEEGYQGLFPEKKN